MCNMFNNLHMLINFRLAPHHNQSCPVLDKARREKAVITGDLRPMVETLHQLLEASDKEKVTPRHVGTWDV